MHSVLSDWGARIQSIYRRWEHVGKCTAPSVTGARIRSIYRRWEHVGKRAASAHGKTRSALSDWGVHTEYLQTLGARGKTRSVLSDWGPYSTATPCVHQPEQPTFHFLTPFSFKHC